MNNFIQVASPQVRTVELVAGVGSIRIVNPAYLRMRSLQFRGFDVGFIVSGLTWGGKYKTIPPGTDRGWDTPRFSELQTSSLEFVAGPDFLQEGGNQVISVEIWRQYVDFSKLLEREGNVPRFIVTLTDPDSLEVVGYFSDVGYADVDNNYYWPFLENLSNSIWGVDINHLQPRNNPFNIRLLNENNMVSDLAAIYRDLMGLKVEIQLLYVQATGLQAVKQIYEGTAEISPEDSTNRKISINVLPIMGERTSGFQRVCSKQEFPNVLERDAGAPMNIVAGEMAGSGTPSNGAMYAPVIDPAVTRILVAQGAIKSVDLVRRKRAGQFTSPAFSSGYSSSGDYTYADISGDAEGDEYYVDLTGIEDAGDGTGTAYLNPADMLKQLAIRHMGYVDGDFNTSSWSAFFDYCALEGFDVTGVSGIGLPVKRGVLVENSRDVFAWAAQSWDVAFDIDYDGKVRAATDIDISKTTDDLDTLDELSFSVDLALPGMSSKKSRTGYMNSITAVFGIEHSSGDQTIDSYPAKDQASIDYNDNDVVSGSLRMPFTRDEDASKVVVTRRLLRAAGDGRRIDYPFFDMRMLELVSGQRVGISDPQPGIGTGAWDKHEVLIESVKLDKAGLKGSMQAVEVGKTFGPIIFPGDAENIYIAEVDTWIESANPDAAHGSDTQLKYGRALGGIPGESERLAMRFDLLAVPESGVQLTGSEPLNSITFEWYVNEFNNDRTNILNGTMRKLDQGDWGDNSTWDNFTLDGAGIAWADAMMTDIWAQVQNFGGTLGWKSQLLNATALAAYQAALGASGKVNMSLNIGRFGVPIAGDDTNEYMYMGSSESSVKCRIRLNYQII